MWFDGQRQPNTIYVANTSRGKDSTAMLRAIQLMGWPLDMICSVDIWATQDIPAELPPMVKFKDEYDQKVLDWFGVPVTRLCATKRSQNVNAERERERERPERLSYADVFYSMPNGKYAGTIKGFPGTAKFSWCKKLKTGNVDLRGYILSSNFKRPQEREREREAAKQAAERRFPNLRIPANIGNLVSIRTQTISNTGFPNQNCRWCTGELKKAASTGSQFRRAGTGVLNSKQPLAKPLNEGQKINIVHYLGIAADEPLRIAKHMPKKDKVLPLVQIGWDEALCGLEAQYMDMLSPTYSDGHLRDGCWFCHNQNVDSLRRLRRNYPDLWALLMKWDADSPVTFHADGRTVHDFDRRFQLEDEGLIDPRKPFFWRMLDEELNYKLF